MTRSVLSKLFLIVAVSVVAVSARAGDVSYEYDAQGRLVTTIDNTKYCTPGGGGNCPNGVGYTYDAAGNITAITALGAGPATFYALSANSGAVGSSLVIEGDQFITQAGQTVSVYFPNSNPATVSKVTVSEIDVTVPSNAVSGTLSVVTPNGNVTTSTFTVQ